MWETESYMRTRGRIDANQSAIVRALRQAGASVQSLANLGSGCPDLLVGFQGKNILMEIKDGNAKPSKQKLTADEAEWHASWQGTVDTVTSVEEALVLLEARDE